MAQGRPGWALRALAEPAWLARFERWGEELARLAFEDVDGVLTYATRFGQGPQVDQRIVATEALRSLTAWLRDALLLTSGVGAPMTGRRAAALAEWARQVPPERVRSSLASAQRTQLLIDQNVNPRLAMEVLLLDSRLGQTA